MLLFLGLHSSKLRLTTLLKCSRLENRLLRCAFYFLMYSRQKTKDVSLMEKNLLDDL